MKRRTYLKSMLATATAGIVAAPKAKAQAGKPRSIELHCDIAVDPKREQEMLANFEKIFRPEAKKHPGYIDLKMLKLNSAIRGNAPTKYQFVLTFASEDLRQKWIATKEHARVWPEIEKTMTNKDTFSILVYDVY